jgi:GntR family transcriptional regulator / MocR family aminotransferase
MSTLLDLTLDRSDRTSLAEQIHEGIRRAIVTGQLKPGARLPSWRDLAVQLGVARGTVKAAYERLADINLVAAAGPAGTRVCADPALIAGGASCVEPSARGACGAAFSSLPKPFQMGVPAHDAFPFKTWARVMARATRTSAAMPTSYPDPKGDRRLREEIAASLAVTRGMICTPEQVMVTTGFAGAIGLTLYSLDLRGGRAWVEDPAYWLVRNALEIAGVACVPVPVDSRGIDVRAGIERAADAALAVVTPGQQAPLGMTMAPERRLALLEWARRCDGWIVEDDYLAELQLEGRAPPALAAGDRTGRVIHIGTFSKTLSPALRLGFVVVPLALASRFADAAAHLAPAPASPVQHAVAEFMAGGHYLRHLRRMKRLYAARREALIGCLGKSARVAPAGLAVLLEVPEGAQDIDIARDAHLAGISPEPLSPLYADARAKRSGLLLGVSNLTDRNLATACEKLLDAIGKHR